MAKINCEKYITNGQIAKTDKKIEINWQNVFFLQCNKHCVSIEIIECCKI